MRWRQRQIAIDRQALHLVEHRGVGGVQIVLAVDAAGADHVDRRGAGEHAADLHRRGVGTHHQPGGVQAGRRRRWRDEQRVLHLPGRMIRWEVQRVEVQPLGLQLRALGDLPTHRDEDVADPLHHRRDRMACPGRVPICGQADVDGLGAQHGAITLGEKLLLAQVHRAVHPGARGADEPAGDGPLGLVEAGDRPVGQGQRRTVSGVLEPRHLQGVEVGGVVDGIDRGGGRRVDGNGIGRIDLEGRGGHQGLPGTGRRDDVGCRRPPRAVGFCSDQQAGPVTGLGNRCTMRHGMGFILPCAASALARAGGRPVGPAGDTAGLRR